MAIAHHAAAGDEVHVLTCTLGEEGEVIPAELAHLEGAAGDPLGEHRRGELAAALSALGARGEVLADERYRDSGMAGSPASTHPRALVAAPLAEVATAVREVVDRLCPDLVVTYDPTGWYGHPDHVRTYEAVVTALSGMPSPPPLFSVVLPRSWALEDREWVRALPAPEGDWVTPGADTAYPSSVVPDESVDVIVTGATAAHAQRAALRAHATQVIVGDGDWFTLSDRVLARLSGREAYRRVDLAVAGGMVRSALEPTAFRSAMGQLPSGVSVVSTVVDGVDHAMTADTVTSVSLDPLMLLVSVDRSTRFHDALLAAGRFAVSVLAAQQESVSVWLATKGRPLAGQLDEVPHTRGALTGAALVEGALAHLECRVDAAHAAGDHTIVVARVVSIAVAADPSPALVHHRGRYGRLS